jgi:hypothetical protein
MTNACLEMKSVQTALPGWRVACSDLARDQQDFLVENAAAKDLGFLRKLCRRYNYRKFIIQKGFLFLPDPRY